MYGQGLNSIRWRFALGAAVLTLAGLLLRDAALGRLSDYALHDWLSAAAVCLGVSGAIFFMASRLTLMIDALRRTTDAITAGELDRPVQLDCTCEVGGLANSLRRMTERLNANILRMNALAYTDAITGLPNRSAIDHLLRYALAPDRDQPFRAAMIFIDLDGFKRINDTLGHDGGDILLQMASQRILERGLRRTREAIDACTDTFGNPCERLPRDVVFARFAGDEFVAVLPGTTDRVELAAIGARIIASLREPFRIMGHDVTVGASLGIAVTPDDTTSAVELLTFADLAMYSSKQAGKSRFMFFDMSVREAILERARIEEDLRLALKRHELVLHYQPKLDARTLVPVGVEALVRWQHPARGLLMPGAFIDVAEQCGLMTQLGQQVLGLAVAQARAWERAGTPRVVALNVSPSQFTDPQFVPMVLQTIGDAGLSPNRLSIEITESIAMKEYATAGQRLGVLRDAGVLVAIDDFGVGFSNLSQLSRLPVDELKIDRSLVAEIGLSAKSEAIILTILGIARTLGYRTIAEGIETPEQLAHLRLVGCDAVQGYLFAKPMDVRALEQWSVTQHQLCAQAPAAPAAVVAA